MTILDDGEGMLFETLMTKEEIEALNEVLDRNLQALIELIDLMHSVIEAQYRTMQLWAPKIPGAEPPKAPPPPPDCLKYLGKKMEIIKVREPQNLNG
jgi:hypothetical protein